MEKLTKRLFLGEFTKQDVDAIAEFKRDPRYLDYYYRPAYTREECVRFVDSGLYFFCIGTNGPTAYLVLMLNLG